MCFIYLGLLLLGVCSVLYPCVMIVLFSVFWLCRLKNLIYDLINKMVTAFAIKKKKKTARIQEFRRQVDLKLGLNTTKLLIN